jgi:hypothetical protein
MVQTREALEDLNKSLDPEVVQAWTEMAEAWERDETKPNPFEMQRKDAHVAKVRAELAEEVSARETRARSGATCTSPSFWRWGFSSKTSSEWHLS